MLIVSSLSLRMSKVAPSKSVPASANPQTKTQNAKHDTAPTIGPATNSGLDVGGRRARGNMVTVDGADDIHESVVDVTKTEVPASPQKADSTDSIANLPINGRNYITLTNSQVVRELAPMIEKTASLSLTVKEMEVARAALEDIEKRHHGYFAELNSEGQSEAGRTLTASLRVPIGELDATLGELRKLGHLDEEKQGGEEVSQKHVDLEARLRNARNTEKRLTDLLTKRAAKLKDILDVERELADTREEIERMEAQLRNMENQVSYAAIDLNLREEYKPALNLAPPATGARLRNALVDGYKSDG